MKRNWLCRLAAMALVLTLLAGCTRDAEPKSADSGNAGVTWTGVLSYIDGTTVTITLGELSEGPDGRRAMALGDAMEVFTLTEACRVFRVQDAAETEMAQRELAVGDAVTVQFGENGAVTRIEVYPEIG